MTPAPDNNPLPPASESRFAVLLFSDIVGSTDLKARHGVPAYRAALQVHNEHFERLARTCHVRILQNMGDGYFAEAGSVAEAVRFALLFQDAMRAGPWNEIPLTTRVGIHAGEVTALVTEGGSGIVAPAADLAARVMSLALGGQILLTRFPFDEARHFLREHPAVAGRDTPPLRWLAHGPYLLKGRDEPMEIFEVGAEGFAPLTPPPDGEKAKRAIRPGEEETLGWRPAIGLEIPGRPGWRLTEKLGAGGFGEVWTGEHAKLRQRRAFKFCFDDERLRALKREVTLVRLLRTALGDRDDIVRFHELKLDAPPFYLESDLAPHGNLLQWAEKQGGLAAIPLAQRIALVAHTATALAAAHSIGVLHKDIKPTNILIFDAPDGTVRPRLVDFGIGTLADPAVLGQHGVTAAGFTRATIEHSTGTPTYSPPEYLAGKPYTVQGDIYGLGVLLYQLLTADSTRPLAPGWERDIPDPLLREDIAACVDGDPARRLPSAADLADRLFHLEQRRADIAEKERLTREAAARAESEANAVANRIRIARLRKLAGAFAVLALLAIAGGILAWVNQRKANAARSAAETAGAEVVQQKTEVERQKAEVERENTKNRAMLAEAARSDRLVAEDKMKASRASEAFAYFARSYDYDQRFTFTAERTVAALNSWASPLPTTVLVGHTDKLWSAHFSPDGKRVVSASWDNTARIWDANTGRTILSFSEYPPLRPYEAHFSPDGERIILAAERKNVWVRSSTNGARLVQLIGHERDLIGARFSPDGTRVLTSTDKTAHLWDAATGALLATMSGHELYGIKARFSADGQLIVTFSVRGPARVWNSATGALITTLSLPGERFEVSNADFSPDRKRIVISGDNTPRVCDAANGQTVFILSGHSNSVPDARFSHDGKRIVTASYDKTAKVWDAATGKPVITLTGHESGVETAQFSPDGNRIITTEANVFAHLTARVWDRRSGRCIATLLGNLVTAEFSPDGRRILGISADHSIRIWELSDLERDNVLAGHKNWVVDVQFSPDGQRIVTASWDNTARVWSAATGTLLATLSGHKGGLNKAQFSPDGTQIATASADETARIWDAATGKAVAVSSGHTGGLNSVRFSLDGTRIVTASEDKTARVWDSTSGKLLTALLGHEKELMTAQFSPDGTRIVTASREENAARIWDAATGQQIKTLAGFENGAEAGKLNAEYSPDGKRILTGSWYQTARVWDAATGQPLLTLSNKFGDLVSAHFSADATRVVTGYQFGEVAVSDAQTGKQLATISKHQGLVSAQFNPDATRVITISKFGASAIVWDASTGKRIATLAGHEKGLSTVCYSPDGTRIVTGSQDTTARVWDALPPSAGPPPEWFPDFLRYMAQMRLNPDGELETLKAADWLALRERLRAVLRASTDTPYLRILRKYVRD